MSVVGWSQQPQWTTCERLGHDAAWPHTCHRQSPETGRVELRHPPPEPVVIPPTTHRAIRLDGKIVLYMIVGQFVDFTTDDTPTLFKDSKLTRHAPREE